MTFGYPMVDLITPDLSGLYRIDHEAYHAGLGISSTKIKDAIKTWGHYNAEKRTDTPAMAFGRAFHMAILEPEEFRKRYIVAPDLSAYGHPNSNVYRAAKAEFATTHADKEVLKPDQMADIETMIEKLKQHPKWNLAAGHSAEIMGIKTDERTGLKLKCKMDLFGSTIIDLKTTTSADKDDFDQQCIDRGYYISAAFYQDVMTAVTGERFPFILVACEKVYPYGVAFVEVKNDLLDLYRPVWREAADKIVKWNSMVPAQRALHYGSGLREMYATTRHVYKAQALIDNMRDQ